MLLGIPHRCPTAAKKYIQHPSPIPLTMPPDLRRRRPLSDCFARLRRELDGTKSTRRYVPPELTSYYIDDLEPTLQIRDYTVPLP
jgi:hypothetical protein